MYLYMYMYIFRYMYVVNVGKFLVRSSKFQSDFILLLVTENIGTITRNSRPSKPHPQGKTAMTVSSKKKLRIMVQFHKSLPSSHTRL